MPFKTRPTDVNTNRISGCRKCGKKTHGQSRGKSKNYTRWLNMKDRCHNENSKSFAYYGGRGISVYKLWSDDYLEYEKYIKSLDGYSLQKSIERIDNNKYYEPNNLRWASRNIQSQNTRRLYSNNTSGYRGVRIVGNKYVAVIGVNGKAINLGSYGNSICAAKAYDNYVVSNELNHTINGV